MVHVHYVICETVFGVVVFHTSLVNGGGLSALSIYAFCYMRNFFGVMVFHRSIVNWRRGALVYVYSAICEISLM